MANSLQTPGRNKGFTLIEVMIAVTVFAVIAATLSETTSQSVGNLLYLQEKTLAAFVAENRLTEVRLAGYPSIGETNDVVDMAGREWRVRTVIKDPKAIFPDIRQISISVANANDKEAYLVTLETYTGNH